MDELAGGQAGQEAYSLQSDNALPVEALMSQIVAAMPAAPLTLLLAVLLFACSPATSEVSPSARARRACWEGGKEISTAGQALQMALARFPAGHEPRAALAEQLALSLFVDGWYRGPRLEGWDENTTVWVAALLGDGLTIDDVLPPPPFAAFKTADAAGYRSPGVAGVYYVWDVCTGELVAEGVLEQQRDEGPWNTYDALYALAHRGGEG